MVSASEEVQDTQQNTSGKAKIAAGF